MIGYPRHSIYLTLISLLTVIALRDTLFTKPKVVVRKSKEHHHAHLASDGTAATDFVFLVALEGSGHHMHSALYDKSPAMKRLNEVKARPLVNDMLVSLYNNNDKSNALFSAPLGEDAPDGTSVVKTLAKKLRIVDDKIWKASYPNSTMVPLNAGGIAEGITGMMSYPNFHGRDRALQYPDISTLYYACDVADVSCRHVILTRDPYAVIRSTTMNREYSTKHKAIQIYTMMLDVVYTQMITHPDHLAACWDYDDIGGDDLGALMGWDRSGGIREDRDEMSFRETYASLFHGSAGTNSTERMQIIPEELAVYMLNMEQATERVRSTCRTILQSDLK